MDITTDIVKIAIVSHGVAPVMADYKDAEWTNIPPAGTSSAISRQSIEYRYFKVTGTVDGASSTAWARIVVGSDIVLTTAGSYDCWVKVVDNPESPAILAGQMTVS